MTFPAQEDTSVPGDMAWPLAEKPLCPQHTYCLGAYLFLYEYHPVLSDEQVEEAGSSPCDPTDLCFAVSS